MGLNFGEGHITGVEGRHQKWTKLLLYHKAVS